MNESNALSSLKLNENKTRFKKALTSRTENIPIENYAISFLPLDLANFHLSDANSLPKMSKRSRAIIESSDEEEEMSLSSVKIKEEIDMVLL